MATASVAAKGRIKDIVFEWEGKDKNGKSVRGEMRAGGEAMLKAGFKPEDLDGNWKPFRAVGCSMCNNGYKGRVGIYQVMPITEEIQKIILASGSSMDIAEQAQREGVRDLRQSGLIKVRNGLTTLEELISVTNE